MSLQSESSSGEEQKLPDTNVTGGNRETGSFETQRYEYFYAYQIDLSLWYSLYPPSTKRGDTKSLTFLVTYGCIQDFFLEGGFAKGGVGTIERVACKMFCCSI